MRNALMVIFPYRHEGMWVFDDDRVGLVREPFVFGADEMLNRATATVPGAHDGVRLIFSAAAFPGHQVRLVRQRADYEGNWYLWAEQRIEGWLCPALLRYFEQAPDEIFIRIEPKG